MITRRNLCLSGAGLVAGVSVPTVLLADSAPQPLALQSHFPQMPTGGEGVTPCGSFDPPSIIPSSGRIAPSSEPGEPLEISGVVYHPDRKTPAPGIVIFAYHTDRAGAYNRPNSPFKPRLYGWLKSDAAGRYAFRTIKPAPYPDHSNPAHIHVSLFGPGYPEYWIDDYWFEGDPLITAQARRVLTGRGGGNETLRLSKNAGGVLHGSRDLVLQHVAVSGNCKLLNG